MRYIFGVRWVSEEQREWIHLSRAIFSEIYGIWNQQSQLIENKNTQQSNNPLADTCSALRKQQFHIFHE